MSEALSTIYFAPPHDLDEKVKTYIQNTRKFLTQYETVLHGSDGVELQSLETLPAYQNIIVNGPDKLLNALNEAVSQYQLEAEKNIQRFERLETMLAVSG